MKRLAIVLTLVLLVVILCGCTKTKIYTCPPDVRDGMVNFILSCDKGNYLSECKATAKEIYCRVDEE